METGVLRVKEWLVHNSTTTMGKPTKLGYAVAVKSKYCTEPLLIECSDLTFDKRVDHNICELTLKLYNVSSVYRAGKDITEICIIEDHVMQINNIMDCYVVYMYGEITEELINNLNINLKEL